MKTIFPFTMRQIQCLLFAFLLKSTCCFAQEDTLKVLFIGNSLTYFNEMPTMFEEISLNKGKKVKAEYYAPGGTGIANHIADPNVYSLLRQPWDVLILQPGTAESPGVSWPIDTTRARTQILLDSLHLYNPCARGFIYEIPYGIPTNGGYPAYFSVQQRIRDSIAILSDGLHVQTIPAGECARAYYSLHQDISLHNSENDIHPNANGSYMTALSCYSTIFQEKVTGCTYYASTDPQMAQYYFSIVDTVVLDRMEEWNINTYNLHAAFDYTRSSYDVIFDNNSVNETDVEWSFGDAQTSTESDPVHTYSGPGTYTVTLYAMNGTCVDSTKQEITLTDILSSGSDQLAANLKVFPNPAAHTLTVSNDSGFESYSVIDMRGNEIMSGAFDASSKEGEIDVSSLASGQYVIRLATHSGACFATFSKQ